MIPTRICDLLGIDHPIVLGGMGTATTAPLVAAVSNAGGFGTLGTAAFNAATLESEIGAIPERTDKPFGGNHLVFQIRGDMFNALNNTNLSGLRTSRNDAFFGRLLGTRGARVIQVGAVLNF